MARYKQVLQAYADGLKRRVDKQQEIGEIYSVASFFISRIDSSVDALLPTDSNMKGQTAIANAVMAYQAFLDFLSTPSWKELENRGANLQRPLWASTGVKDPSFDSNLYVLNLVAANTVNTMPEATLNSVKNSGVFKHELIPAKISTSKSILAKIALAGIDLSPSSLHSKAQSHPHLSMVESVLLNNFYLQWDRHHYSYMVLFSLLSVLICCNLFYKYRETYLLLIC